MKSQINKNFLSKKQLLSIGFQKEQQIPEKYWNSQINRCFNKFANIDKVKQKDLQNQTYQQFIKMDLSGPNQQGDGRYRFQQIQKIQIVIIRSKLGQSQCSNDKKTKIINKKQFKKEINIKEEDITQQFELIQQLLSSFFQISTTFRKDLKFSINPMNMNIIDQKQMIQYTVRKTSNKQFDVWSLFDLGMEIKQKLAESDNKLKRNKKNKTNSERKTYKNSIILFLIQANLSDDGSSVDGRAIGDGIAFITFKYQNFYPTQLKSIIKRQHPCYTLPILIHQCLHTLGFDHCSAWQCLMNSITNNQYMLCPACVRKLQSEVNKKVSLKDWHEQLHRILQKIKNSEFDLLKKDKRACSLFFNLVLNQKQIVQSQNQNQNNFKNPTMNYNSQNYLLQNHKLSPPLSMLQKCSLILKSFKK